ncbi:hypothetical protein [Rhizobium leguminosarum]|uniref:hypothetical protein n=1 Tax=Rhizobium leguminosarum TaxID=384 RepID=UPI0014411B87|nr:hypothetical protein [Rhizobium leguminosarum]NKK76066.1 hypothetical protein [Rhizobium leguminosarum bv. viciae]
MADDPGDYTPTGYRNPVVMLAMLILISLFLMIGASILGIDHGFLAGMARPELARGLITYLFAVVTIGIAVALVLDTLIGPPPGDANDRRFQRAKEVLSLLLGVFGTIVGYYFGSESSEASRPVPFELSSPDLSPLPVGPAAQVTVRAVIRGGLAPFRYGIAEGSKDIEVKDLAFDGGWIVKQLTLTEPVATPGQSLHIIAEDANGKRVETVVPLRRSNQD